jgi:hypothetical protein
MSLELEDFRPSENIHDSESIPKFTGSLKHNTPTQVFVFLDASRVEIKSEEVYFLCQNPDCRNWSEGFLLSDVS